MPAKLAIFDVDGTLFKGNLGIEFLKLLMAKQLFSPEIGAQIMSWYGKYKSGEVDKAQVVDEIYKLYAQGMTGMTTETAKSVAKETFQAVSSNIFPFAKEVADRLTNAGYMLILLSGSPIEMIEEIADYLAIPHTQISAGTLEVQDGKYTGTIISYPGSAEQKVAEIEKLIQKLRIEPDWANSIAMGDNERDSLILSKVGKAYAFEPNDVLQITANDHGWNIVNSDNILSIIK